METNDGKNDDDAQINENEQIDHDLIAEEEEAEDSNVTYTTCIFCLKRYRKRRGRNEVNREIAFSY